MATRKKQTPNVPSGGWPKIVQGTHLTVKTFEDGRTELVWDDEQLLKEVREAIASVTPASKKSKKFNFSEPKKITTENGDHALQVTVTKKATANKKTEADALNAYNDERLVSRHDKIQAEKKTTAKKKTK